MTGAELVRKSMLDGLPDGVVSFDHDLAILAANRRLAAILGTPEQALESCASLPELLAASTTLDAGLRRDLQAACRSVQADRDRAPAASVFEFVGGSRRLTLHLSRIGEGQWMARLGEHAGHGRAEASPSPDLARDLLTGLHTRAVFQQRIAAALGDPEGCAVMMVDLDRFKAVNDTLGHPIGDALLALVAKRLQGILRQGEVVARLGGDEFAVLFSPCPARATLAALARRIVDVVGRPYLVDGHLVNVGASIGIGCAPDDGREPADLLKNADLALHAVKNAGRGAHRFFEPAMDARARSRRALEIDLRRAMLLGELELHYQPQVDLQAARVTGFEALLRWRHPERGLVSPAEFIPLAEEIGLIANIGDWVIRNACLEAARWPVDIGVAVNVSALQFGESGRLLGTVRDALAHAGLAGTRLEVEITESVLMRSQDAVRATLHALREMGVRVAMDDFGTGYSSLSQLRSFPFDKIKIDRSFVCENDDAAGQAAIIRAITALGGSLGMATIAEGVETPGQLARIRSEGCTAVQGYLFSRPVPAGQIGSLLSEFAMRHAASCSSP